MPSTPSTPSTPRRRNRELGIRRPRVAGRTGPVPARPAERPWREDERDDDGRTVEVLAPLPRRPETTEPETAESQTAESQTAEPQTAEPETAEFDTAESETVESATAGSETVETRTEAVDRTPVAGFGTGTHAGPQAASRPSGKRGRGPRGLPAVERTHRRIPTLVLVGLLVVLTAGAVFFGVANASLRGTPAAQNSALVEVGATAQAAQQLGDALKAAYSYDFARLDQNEAAAKAGIVPNSTFMTQYGQLFSQVRQLAPAQQAVVSATVVTSAVREITGDRAVVVVFLDQQITRVETGNQARQQAAAARVTITGQLVDGAWKIADLQVL